MSCSIDGVVFFKVNDPEKAIPKVENFNFAITQLCTSCFKRCMWKSRVRHYTSKKRGNGKNIKAIVEKENRSLGYRNY
jgi:regulator of protease activity HflC (stomatin/prohibitin superfamily)